MKTLGELRETIVSNGGELQIGALVFKCQSDTDVDVHFDGQLIMWFPKNEAGSALLCDKVFSISGDVDEARAALKRKRDGEREEHKTNEFLAEAVKKELIAQNAIGKVEAYEKLLIGRNITISK